MRESETIAAIEDVRRSVTLRRNMFALSLTQYLVGEYQIALCQNSKQYVSMILTLFYPQTAYKLNCCNESCD